MLLELTCKTELVYHFTKLQDNADQPEEICINFFVSRQNPKIPFVFWIWKNVDFPHVTVTSLPVVSRSVLK